MGLLRKMCNIHTIQMIHKWYSDAFWHGQREGKVVHHFMTGFCITCVQPNYCTFQPAKLDVWYLSWNKPMECFHESNWKAIWLIWVIDLLGFFLISLSLSRHLSWIYNQGSPSGLQYYPSCWFMSFLGNVLRHFTKACPKNCVIMCKKMCQRSLNQDCFAEIVCLDKAS